MAKETTTELKPLSCKLGLHRFSNWYKAYAHFSGDEKEFPLLAAKCYFCSKWKFRET